MLTVGLMSMLEFVLLPFDTCYVACTLDYYHDAALLCRVSGIYNVQGQELKRIHSA